MTTRGAAQACGQPLSDARTKSQRATRFVMGTAWRSPVSAGRVHDANVPHSQSRAAHSRHKKEIEVGSARHDLDRERELDLGVEPHPHLVVAQRLDWLEGEETMTVEDDSRLLLDRIDHVALGN